MGREGREEFGKATRNSFETQQMIFLKTCTMYTQQIDCKLAERSFQNRPHKAYGAGGGGRRRWILCEFFSIVSSRGNGFHVGHIFSPWLYSPILGLGRLLELLDLGLFGRVISSSQGLW
jgi:hypothetical protein